MLSPLRSRGLLGAPSNFLNGKNAPGFFFIINVYFFLEMHCTPFLLHVFLSFSVFRVALSPIRGFVVNG